MVRGLQSRWKTTDRDDRCSPACCCESCSDACSYANMSLYGGVPADKNRRCACACVSVCLCWCACVAGERVWWGQM